MYDNEHKSSLFRVISHVPVLAPHCPLVFVASRIIANSSCRIAHSTIHIRHRRIPRIVASPFVFVSSSSRFEHSTINVRLRPGPIRLCRESSYRY